ncbi:MAG: DUF58 domain-containing protein, partial [Myxococcota bacterium]|nr:DUF58 domain-containing protein [Myxococcota bacterium]
MPPQLSSSGRASLAIASIWMLAAAILLGAGYPAAAWPVLFASSALFALLMVAFYLSIPVGRLLEPPQLEAILELPEQTLMHAGEPIRIRVELRGRGPFALRAMQLRAELSSSLSTPAPLCLDVPASSSVSTEFELEAARSGRYFVHGFHLEAWGPLRLFRIRSYLASACALVVLPRRTPLSIDASRAAPRRSERLGAHELSQRGFGMQLREIRDHQPGDPYRNIAWKASARLGRLMVREFENEVAVSAYLMLDISTSMRGASDRPDKLEHAIELCMAMARSLSKGSDRFGLI